MVLVNAKVDTGLGERDLDLPAADEQCDDVGGLEGDVRAEERLRGRLPSGSRTSTQRIGITGVPGLYHKAVSDVISSVLPSTWPYQADTMILAQVVTGLDRSVSSFGSAGPFCAGWPRVRVVRFGGGANRLASSRSRLMSVAGQ